MVKRVAVIGAGASGLVATKSCLEEGLEPVTFERTESVGGLWHFTEEVRDDQACVMRSTVINTSKELMTFSDFLIPAKYPNMMHNRYIDEYFRLYSQQFDLERYIRYSSEIRFITRAPDYDTSGQWLVTYRDRTLGDDAPEVVERFDGVLLCTGHHASKHVPAFPGQDSFQGRIVHTHDYKDHRGMEGKNVVVIGVGNSGVDVAAELAKIAKQVYMVTRRGVWLTKKSDARNLPWDVVRQRRSHTALGSLLGAELMADILEKEANSVIDHRAFGLQPKHRIYAQHPTANDDLPYAILCGLVVVKPGVAEVRAHSVLFEDGTEADADVIILATGYNFGFNYLDKKVLDVKKNEVRLYKSMYPPELPRGSLAVIGCVQPLGSLFPIAEVQSRWAVRVIKGVSRLPSSEEMEADITRKQAAMRRRYTASQRHTIQADWIPYMDEIASLVGCKPNLGQLWLKDPRLAYHVFFGPCTPVQYRLSGPHAWSGARHAILTTMDRVYTPIRTRTPEGSRPEGFWTMDRIGGAVFLVLLFFFNVLLIFCLWLYM